MAGKIVVIDTSILIDLFRKTDKDNALLVSLVKQGYGYYILAVTEYEIYRGALLGQVTYWNNLLQRVQVLPFDKATARVAVDINFELKRKRKQIAIPDLFIAATAISHNLPLATLNRKHFDRIDRLMMIE
jgi:predicted nucleic acid-binding protein